MEIKVRQKDGVIILDISGAIDVNGADLVEMVSRCLHDGYHDILLNCDDVTALDYMGVSVVVIAYKQVVNHHGRMKLSGVRSPLLKVLHISGIDKTIELYPSEQLALESFKSDQALEEIQKLPLRRRFKRLPIGVKGCLCPGRGAAEGPEEVTVMNLSAVGAYVYGSSRYKLGDEVLLRMNLSQQKEALELEAKVVWLPDEQIQHRISPGMGIEFHTIDAGVQQKLLQFIERNLSSLPSD